MIAKHFRSTLAALLFLGGIAAAAQTHSTSPALHADPAYGKLPLAFEPNRGQVGGVAGSTSDVQFLARGSRYTVLLEPRAATLLLSHDDLTQAQARAGLLAGKPVTSTRTSVRMTLDGANPQAAMSPEHLLPGYVSYMTGGNPSHWQVGLPTYAATRVAQAYPGIDLVYYGNERQLEYDFVVSPNADPATIHLAIEGAHPVLETAGETNGELRLQLAATRRDTDILFRKPVVYQQIDGTRKPIEASFTVAANGEVGFKVGSYDRSRALVIDPIISYASYFGGSAEDEINGSTLNANNQLYAVGQTFSTSLPGTSGEFETGPAANNNGHDAFVTKFSADGSSVVWTTYLSGAGDDFATSVAVNGSDEAYVVGYTASCGSGGSNYQTVGEFPFTATAVQSLCNPNLIGFNSTETNGAGYDVFLVKLSSDGKSELYGTPLGGTANDIASSVALDAAGKVYIVGETSSTQYFAPGANSRSSPIPNYPGGVGTANYPTTANAFYTNTTESRLYASTQSNGDMIGPQDEQAFLTVLSSDLSSIVYSSLIGGGIIGGCGNGDCNTNGLAIAVNASGNAFIGGNTSSAHWPTTAGAFAATCSNAGAATSQCPMNGWLAGFDPTKSGSASLLFSTYMDGSSAGKDSNGNQLDPGSDVYGLTVDAAGNVIATGDTNANNFPTTSGTLQPACVTTGDGNGDSNVCVGAFLTKLTPAGATVWSTYFGPTKTHGAGDFVTGLGVATDSTGNIYMLGSSVDPTLILKNPVVSTPSGQDAFLIEVTPTASAVLMGTYLGAGGGIAINTNSLHLDSDLNAYFSGSQAPNPYGGTYLPITPNAFDKTIQGADGFVVKMITQQQPSATALTVSPTSATPAQTVTLTATVTTPSTLTGAILPTGTVTFLNGTTTLGTGTLNASGVATYSGKLAGATYSITASYGGDAGFNPSVSSAVPLVVSSAVATTTALTVAPASSSYGTATTMTAKVAAGTAPATSGTVSFAAGSVTFGTASVNAQGVATLTTNPAVGIYSVVATYAGTYNATSNPTGFAPSASSSVPVTVTKAASTTVLTSSASSAGTAAKITLTATVTSGATGTVTFYNGTASLGTGTLATGGTATLVTSFSAAGSYSLTAVYAGDTNFTTSTSAALTQVVIVPGFSFALTPPSLTITGGATGTTALAITPTGGFTGAVTLACGTLPTYMTCSFSPSTATLTSAAVTDTLTIGTGTASAALVGPQLRGSHTSSMLAGILGLPGILMGLLVAVHRKKFEASTRQMIVVTALLFVTLGAVIGCGSSTKASAPPTTNETPAGSYTVPVTATSGSISTTVNLQITVQ